MTNEEKIRDALYKQYDFLKDCISIQRTRRINLETTPERLQEILPFIIKLFDFNFICAITGLDEGARFRLIYHLANQAGVILSLKISIPKEKPVLATVTALFPSADIYERELVDLLGIQVEGLTPGFKYPLPDDWPAGEYPLRKDWHGNKTEQADSDNVLEGGANAS